MAFHRPGDFLVGVAFVIYLPSFHSPFHLDDIGAIVNDPYYHIHDLKPHTLFRAAFKDFKQNRPLTNITLALNYYFGGLNPFGYHVVNFLVFLLTAFGIWLTLQKLLVRLGFDAARVRPGGMDFNFGLDCAPA